jgi:hypothetical protein
MSRELALLTGYPGTPMDLGRILAGVYRRAHGPSITRLGFAYVSDYGLDALLSGLQNIAGWRDTIKEWIVGLHHGITEPKALERIRTLPNSRPRVFIGAERLSTTSLRIGRVFHAKIVSVTSGVRPSGVPVCLLASSANLTGAALGLNGRNYEAGMAAFGSLIARTQYEQFRRWWARACTESDGVTDVLLDQYTRLRDQFLLRNSDSLADLDPPSLPELGAAGTLWIEAGAMSGGSRNQVEFSEELAEFFGPIERATRLLRIRANAKEWDDRPLSHKITTFGVEIWRLSLPTENSGGFYYPGKVICLRRFTNRDGQYVEVDVAGPRSQKYARWRSTAHRQGYVGLTSGQRAYGFF